MKSDSLTSKARNLPELLRPAERRLNAFLFHKAWPDFARIPADRGHDLDLLVCEAADVIEQAARELTAIRDATAPGALYANVAIHNTAEQALRKLSANPRSAVETHAEVNGAPIACRDRMPPDRQDVLMWEVSPGRWSVGNWWAQFGQWGNRDDPDYAIPPDRVSCWLPLPRAPL